MRTQSPTFSGPAISGPFRGKLKPFRPSPSIEESRSRAGGFMPPIWNGTTSCRRVEQQTPHDNRDGRVRPGRATGDLSVGDDPHRCVAGVQPPARDGPPTRDGLPWFGGVGAGRRRGRCPRGPHGSATGDERAARGRGSPGLTTARRRTYYEAGKRGRHGSNEGPVR